LTTKIQGQRIKTQDAAGNPNLAGAAAGAFGKNKNGDWYALHPTSAFAVKLVSQEPILEHADGNITVTGQIVAMDGIGSAFVGTIVRGVWVSA